MALDAWLFDQHCQGLLPSTLRFYTWSPPAISLGYHQRHWPDWANLNWQGQPVEVVRRPTGGRAVLHYQDLTYAVVTSDLAGKRLQVYERICEFLIQGWRSLGVELQYGDRQQGYQHHSNCFETATGADLILADGTKFIGSAQVWRSKTVLQHGSMQLNPDPELWTQVFGKKSALSLQRPLQGSLRNQLDLEQITATLASAASHCFEAEVVVQPLSPSEWQAVLRQSAKGFRPGHNR